MTVHNFTEMYYCERSKLSTALNDPEFRYIYTVIIFQVDRHSVNVLNVSVYLNIHPIRYSAMQI